LSMEVYCYQFLLTLYNTGFYFITADNIILSLIGQ